jgi:hypothetical protein
VEARRAARALGERNEVTMARPTKLEFSMLSAVGPLIADGLSYEGIAAELGVSRRVLFDWLARGEVADAPEGDELFVQFALAVRKAEAELERKLLADMRGAAGKRGEYNRFAWILERRFQTRWGAKQRIEHTGAEGGAIQIDDARAKLMALIDRRASQGGASEDRREPEPRGD